MPFHVLKRMIAHLRHESHPEDAARATDRHLVEHFSVSRDEAAFAKIVERHGPMVMGVCQRILSHYADAEDAFQATFLILARKAKAIRSPERLANWLYGVALRTALEARRLIARRREREKQVANVPDPTVAASQESWEDIKPILDEELARLPDRYRTPIVLCDLESRTREEAAKQLGWPEGTVAGRLARGRKLLAGRLKRRGVTLSVAMLTTLLTRNGTASVPATVVATTIRACMTSLVERGAVTDVLTPQVVELREGVLRAMFLKKIRTLLSVLLLLGVVGIAGGMILRAQLEKDLPGQSTKKKEGPPEQQGVRQIQVFRGRSGITRIAVDPRGKMLATTHTDGRIRVWDLSKRKVRATLDAGNDFPASEAVFSPDGRTLVAMEYGSVIKLWDIPTRRLKHVLKGESYTYDVMFINGGRALLSVSDKAIQRWDVRTGKLKDDHRFPEFVDQQKPGRCWQVLEATFHPDGGLVALTTMLSTKQGEGRRERPKPLFEHAIKLWDVQNQLIRTTIKGERVTVGDVVFSPKGDSLFQRTSKMYARPNPEKPTVWDVKTGKVLAQPENVRLDSYSPNGRTIVGFTSKEMVLWDLKTRQETKRMKIPDRLFALGANGKTVIARTENGELEIRDIQSEKRKGTLIQSAFDNFYSGSFQFSSDGKEIGFYRWSSSIFNVHWRNTVTGKHVRTDNHRLVDLGEGRVYHRAVSPDLSMFAFSRRPRPRPGSKERDETELWHVPSGKKIIPPFMPEDFSILGFSPDSKLVVGRTAAGQFRIWDLTKQNVIQSFNVRRGPWFEKPTLLFDPAGKRLLVVRLKRNLSGADVAVLNVISGKLTQCPPIELKDPSQFRNRTLAVSAECRYLALGRLGRYSPLLKRAGDVLVFDLRTGKLVLNHRFPTTALAFSPDGASLATGGWDGEIELWDVTKGKLAFTTKGHLRTVSSVAFSPDGKTLASGGDDHTVRVWDITSLRK